MGIIPLDEDCFWCIIPYSDHVEICRQGISQSHDECDWYKLTTKEKEAACNKLIQEMADKYLDFPDVSKRPICFEV